MQRLKSFRMPRESYQQLTIEDFEDHMSDYIRNFVANMKNLDIEPRSMPEWMEMLCAWMEVGTDMEEEYYSE